MRAIVISSFALSALLFTACEQRSAQGTSSDRAPTASTSASTPASSAAADSRTASDYDLKFIDTMTEHHKSGVQMAKMAAAKASHDELKQMAQKMVQAQEQEIAQMSSWRNQWFANAPAAVDHNMPGMHEAMAGMDMSKLMRASGDDFDHEFIDMMTKHHEGAIAMGKDAQTKSSRQEVKAMAAKIADEQSKESQKMAALSAQWFPGHSHGGTARGQ